MNGNSTAPRISRLKCTTRKRSSANPMPNTVLTARAAAVNTMVFCSVCRKIELESKRLKLVSRTKLPRRQHREHERVGDQDHEQEECRCDKRVGDVRITPQESRSTARHPGLARDALLHIQVSHHQRGPARRMRSQRPGVTSPRPVRCQAYPVNAG